MSLYWAATIQIVTVDGLTDGIPDKGAGFRPVPSSEERRLYLIGHATRLETTEPASSLYTNWSGLSQKRLFDVPPFALASLFTSTS